MQYEYQQLDRTGNFRGEILDYGLMEFDSNSVAVNIEVRVDEYWNEETKEWEDWRTFMMRVGGAIFIIKKDGTVNSKQVEALCQHADWNGNLESILDESWNPKPFSFVVGQETYNNEVRLRISWINDYHRQPGALNRIAPERAKELNAKYGASLRAVAGSAKKAAAPNGKPSPPPTRKDLLEEGKQVASTAKATNDDSPF